MVFSTLTFLLLVVPASAQQPLNLADSVREWKSQKDFGYMKSIDSLLRRANQKKAVAPEKEDRVLPATGFLDMALNNRFVKMGLNVLALLFIAWIVYRLIVSVGYFRFSRRKGTKVSTPLIEDQPIEDVDVLRTRAEEAKDWPLAIRYHFLYALKLLAQKNFIEIRAEKTNTDYLAEIESRDFYKDFRELTRYFEYVRYGRISPDAQTYTYIRERFNTFTRFLHNRY